MAKSLNYDLIQTVAKPLWDQMVEENPFAFRSNNEGELFIPKGVEEFRFSDFCDEIRLELQNDDARN